VTTIRQGDRGPAVLELQTLLAMTGHDPGPLDGIFGPRTQAAALDAMMLTPGWAATSRALAPDDLSGLRALPSRAVELPRVMTPIAEVDMRIALVAGYEATTPWMCIEQDGSVAARERLVHQCADHAKRSFYAVRVALAQLAVEHGRRVWDAGLEHELAEKGRLPPPWVRPKAGERALVKVWNNNVGNRPVGFTPKQGLPRVPWFALPAPEGSGSAARILTSACYAYLNAAEGAAAYWRFLRDRCGPALAAFEAGDPARAAHELKIGVWSYSGDEASYTRAMVDQYASLGSP